MNAKEVLKNISKLLNLSEEVKFVDAKAKNGAILQSPTFDVGEKVEVVQEDGSKVPAPDGEHEIALKDSEGNEVIIKIETEGGVITERENVELPEMEEEGEVEEMAKEDIESVETTPLPGSDSEVNEDKSEGALKFPPKGGTSSMMSEVKLEGALGAHPETDMVAPLPSTEDKEELSLVSLKKMMDEMSYRIAELEKTMKEDDVKMEDSEVKEKDIKMEEEEEEELPKLDGAPIEMSHTFSPEEISKRYGKKVSNSQNTFLSKLYR